MVDEHEVRLMVRSLPRTGENEESFGFSVNGVSFAWPYPERVQRKRVRVPRLDSFVVRVAGEEDKRALLAGEPGRFFTTGHFDGFPAAMVRLAEIDPEQLAELWTDAHATATRARSLKTKRLAKQSPYARLMDGH